MGCDNLFNAGLLSFSVLDPTCGLVFFSLPKFFSLATDLWGQLSSHGRISSVYPGVQEMSYWSDTVSCGHILSHSRVCSHSRICSPYVHCDVQTTLIESKVEPHPEVHSWRFVERVCFDLQRDVVCPC